MEIYFFNNANYDLYHRETERLQPVDEKRQPQTLAEYSPDGNHVSYIYQNNIYVKNLKTGLVTELTSDGEKNALINEQPNINGPINIKADVWLATGAKILKGVTIEQGGVVAAGAVLSSNVAPYQIFAGIPAKKISDRK